MANNLDHQLSIEVFETGQQSCQNSYIDCTSYHYIRPILRRINAVTSPYSHYDFYETAVSEAAQNLEYVEVTISGSADYSWLLEGSPLLEGLARSETRANIHIIDGCHTPTNFSLRAAEFLSDCTVKGSTQNIPKSLSGESNSDLIITDAFLTQFESPCDRMAVLREWKRCLKLGGLVITTAQIARDNYTRNAATTNNFVDNVVGLYMCSEYPDRLMMSGDEFAKEVEQYALPTKSRVYQSENELTKEIGAAGLSIVDMSANTIYTAGNNRLLDYREVILSH